MSPRTFYLFCFLLRAPWPFFSSENKFVARFSTSSLLLFTAFLDSFSTGVDWTFLLSVA